MIEPWEVISLEDNDFHFEEDWLSVHIVRGNLTSISVKCKGYFYYGCKVPMNKSTFCLLVEIANMMYKWRHPKYRDFCKYIRYDNIQP